MIVALPGLLTFFCRITTKIVQITALGKKWLHPKGHFFIDLDRKNASNVLSETTGPIKAKFYMEP